jgi:hypothetical protein
MPASCRSADLTRDGVVDASDLLSAINLWGPCPVGFHADITPSNGDGTVGLSEMLYIINNFGTCP